MEPILAELSSSTINIALWVGGIVVLMFQGLVCTLGAVLWSLLTKTRKDVTELQRNQATTALAIEQRHPTKEELIKAVFDLTTQFKDGVSDIKTTMETNHKNLRASIVDLFNQKAEKTDLESLRVRMDNLSNKE